MELIPVGEFIILQIHFDLVTELENHIHRWSGWLQYLVVHFLVDVFAAKASNNTDNAKGHRSERNNSGGCVSTLSTP